MIELCKEPWRRALPRYAAMLLWCLTTVAAAAGPQRSSPPDEAALDRQFQTAAAHFDAGQYAAAEADLKPLLEQAPRNSQVNELAGLVYAAEGQDHRAALYLEKAVELDPKSGAAHNNLAANMARLGNNVRAEAEFRKAVAIEPDSFDPNHDLAEFYARLGKLDAALPYFRRAQKIDPSKYDNGYDLALAEMGAGKYDDARRDVQALLVQRDTGELHRLLAEADEHSGDYIDAVREYESAAHKEPTEDNIFAWGCELLLHATYDPAAQVFSAGIERYPHSSRLELGLGIALYSRGVYDQAVDAFLKASDLDPRDAHPYQFLGKISGLVPEKSAAVTERLHRYAQAAPDNAQAQYDYAMSFWKARRNSNGEAPVSQVQPLLERVLALNPRFPDAHLQLGTLFSEQHQYQKAADQYRQAVALDPGLAEAHYRLGQTLARLGQSSQANQEIQTYQRLHAQQAAEADRKRQEIRQFVLTIQSPPSAAPSAHSTSNAADASIDYSDSASLKPGGISGSVDAGGYSSQAQARGSELRQALGELGPASPGKSAGAGAAESALFQRASALLLSGDYSQAADAFRQGTAQFPESSRMTLGLGVADYSRGRYADAIDALCKAVDLTPAEPQAYFFLARAYSASPAKTEGVLKRLAGYASSHPKTAAAQYDYALCLWDSRTAAGQVSVDPNQVEQLLRAATALDPTLAEAYFQLGVVLAEQGETRQAAEELERAVSLEPQWAEAHYRLGQIYRRTGETEKAQSELDQSERLRKSGDTENDRLRAEIRRLMGV